MPRGSMRKFFEDRGGDESTHRGLLSWPGTADNIPIRGPVGNLTQDEYEALPITFDYHSRLFNLSVDAEKNEFDIVMDRIINHWYAEHRRTDHWDDEAKVLRVWLEWMQLYGEVPLDKTSGVNHAHNNTPTTQSRFPVV